MKADGSLLTEPSQPFYIVFLCSLQMLLQLSAQPAGKEHLYRIQGQENQRTGGKGRQKRRICYLCQPEGADAVGDAGGKEHSADLGQGMGKTVDKGGTDACQKKIAYQIAAAGSHKTADACHIAGKDRQTDGTQQEIEPNGCQGLFWFQYVCDKIDCQSCQSQGDGTDGDRDTDGGEDTEDRRHQSDISHIFCICLHEISFFLFFIGDRIIVNGETRIVNHFILKVYNKEKKDKSQGIWYDIIKREKKGKERYHVENL